MMKIRKRPATNRYCNWFSAASNLSSSLTSAHEKYSPQESSATHDRLNYFQTGREADDLVFRFRAKFNHSDRLFYALIIEASS